LSTSFLLKSSICIVDIFSAIFKRNSSYFKLDSKYKGIIKSYLSSHSCIALYASVVLPEPPIPTNVTREPGLIKYLLIYSIYLLLPTKVDGFSPLNKRGFAIISLLKDDVLLSCLLV